MPRKFKRLDLRADVPVEKPVDKPPKKKEYLNHYVRVDRVAKFNADGWEVVSNDKDKRTHAADLVLMRKEK